MAFSGSYDYTDGFTAASVVEKALARVVSMDAGESVGASEQADALVTLNLILKELMPQTRGTWLQYDLAVFITNPGDKATYQIGPSAASGGTGYAATAWYETEVAVAAVATDTTVTMELTDDGTHVTDGSYIGIKLDDGTIFFTTINDGSINASTEDEAVTLTTAFATGASAAVGNKIYVFNTSSVASRPKEILYAGRITSDTTNVSAASTAVEGNEAELDVIGREDYFNLSQKLQTGPPTSIYYEPTLINGTVHVWPTGDTGVDYDKILLTATYYPDDIDGSTNNLYFPPEWHNALIWALAWELSFEYALPLQERQYLQMVAEKKISDLLDLEYQGETIRFTRAQTPGNK